MTPIHEILTANQLAPSAIAKVVLCGGTSKIVKLQKSIAGMFKDAELLNSLNADEVLATGAAMQAGILQDTWQGDSKPTLKGSLLII